MLCRIHWCGVSTAGAGEEISSQNLVLVQIQRSGIQKGEAEADPEADRKIPWTGHVWCIKAGRENQSWSIDVVFIHEA